MHTIGQAVDYMTSIGKNRELLNHWQRVAKLILAKEDVLRKHDELGLLRYMEPGAGKMAIGRLPAGAQSNATF